MSDLVFASRSTTIIDKELRVLPSNGHCWENSFQCGSAVVRILFKSVLCLNDWWEIRSSHNNQYTLTLDGTGKYTRGM